jgi:hypothetical protein
LIGLFQEINKITNNTTVATVEESSRDTSVSSTTSSANSMNVVINIGWEIVVDNMGDIRDVESLKTIQSA